MESEDEGGIGDRERREASTWVVVSRVVSRIFGVTVGLSAHICLD